MQGSEETSLRRERLSEPLRQRAEPQAEGGAPGRGHSRQKALTQNKNVTFEAQKAASS